MSLHKYLLNSLLFTFTVSLPKFSKQPDDVNVTVCNSASFVCTARGYGLVKITWKRVNYALPITAEVTQEESLNQITSTLKIFEIIGYYSGQYYCVAANRDVEIASQIVNLHVTKSMYCTVCYCQHLSSAITSHNE